MGLVGGGPPAPVAAPGRLTQYVRHQHTVKHGITLIVVACVSLVATYSTYLERSYPVASPLEWLAGLLDYIQLPSFLTSALLSGNFHNPPLLLHYGLVFVTYTCLLLAVVWLWRRRRGRMEADA